MSQPLTSFYLQNNIFPVRIFSPASRRYNYVLIALNCAPCVEWSEKEKINVKVSYLIQRSLYVWFVTRSALQYRKWQLIGMN